MFERDRTVSRYRGGGSLETRSNVYTATQIRRVSLPHHLITMRQLIVVGPFRPVNLSTRLSFRVEEFAGAVLRRESFIKARITLRAILNEPYYDTAASLQFTVTLFATFQTARSRT